MKRLVIELENLKDWLAANLAEELKKRISVEDPEMRHGRKSKSKRLNGYKRHIAVDLDSGLILSGAITPANRPAEEAAPHLAEEIANQNFEIGELLIDRAYVKAALVDDILGRGGEIVCRPWVPRGKGVFTKTAFKINVRDLTITCPAGETERIVFGAVTEFDPEACDHCTLDLRRASAIQNLEAIQREVA